MPRHPSLLDYPVVLEFPVHWGDQDAFGHVNNLMYLRWAETARVEYLTRAGIWQHHENERIGPILARIACDYRRALEYPDSVWVGARVTQVGNSSMHMGHRIVSASSREIAAELDTVLVLYDYNVRKPLRIPEEMRAAIGEIESTMRQS